MKKRLIAAIVAMAVIVVSLATFFIVRAVVGNQPPELEALRPRIIALIEASGEVNEIIWGKGLPTHPRVEKSLTAPYYLTEFEGNFLVSEEKTDLSRYYFTITQKEKDTVVAYQYCVRKSDGNNGYLYLDAETGKSLTAKDYNLYRYAVRKAAPVEGDTPIFADSENGYYYYTLADYEEPERYYTSLDDQYYDYVIDTEEYLVTDDIKRKAETVYGKEYLSKIYESLFTGAVTESGEVQTGRYMDYTDRDGDGHLMKSNKHAGYDVARVYLYDTMRMVKKSNAEFVTIEIDSYKPGREDDVQTVRLTLVLQNGNWFLNSPTY